MVAEEIELDGRRWEREKRKKVQVISVNWKNSLASSRPLERGADDAKQQYLRLDTKYSAVSEKLQQCIVTEHDFQQERQLSQLKASPMVELKGKTICFN